MIPSLQQTVRGWAQLHIGSEQRFSQSGLLSTKTGAEVFKQPSWQYQQIRTVKRGTEYQPKNIKRKRTHGWIKRISTRGGIEVILRRMLKGRKSLTHWDPSDGLIIGFFKFVLKLHAHTGLWGTEQILMMDLVVCDLFVCCRRLVIYSSFINKDQLIEWTKKMCPVCVCVP